MKPCSDFRLAPTLATLTLLVAVVSHAPDALAAPPTTPRATVEALMQHHFSHDMALTAQTVAGKAAWLSRDLRRALDTWLATPQPDDEVPDLSGDPFTNTQESPQAYKLGVAQQRDGKAIVPVLFQDGRRQRRVRLALVTEDGQWKVDDLLYEDGSHLRQHLK